MTYWWVNQNQTFKQEFGGGYLWSPKRRSDGGCNPFYEFMREVAPGDVIFSFAETRIPAIGIAQSTAYEAPKPPEFGQAGPNWSAIGWKVAVRYFRLANPIRPADHINALRNLLPDKYAPMQTTGRGNQGVYLTRLPNDFAQSLIGLMDRQARDIIQTNFSGDADPQAIPEPLPDVAAWEDYLADKIKSDTSLEESQRTALVQARRGQGQFKRNVQVIEKRCRVTRVERLEHLIASHCKPWRDCETYDERLDGENGLLLTPSIDHLFDRGYISFEGDGRLLISPVAHRESLQRMGIPLAGTTNVGLFTAGQKKYLEFHRDAVFLQSHIR